MVKKTITLLIAIMLLAVPITAMATSISDIQAKKEEAEEEKEKIETEKSTQMKEIDTLNESIEENEDKIAEINVQLTKLNKEIKELKKELEETQAKYKKQEEALKEKLILGYEMSSTTYLDFLLNSKGVLDFLSNYYLISEILQNDNDLLDSIEEQKNKIEDDKSQLEEKQKEVIKQKKEQETINVVLENQKIKKQKIVKELSEEEQKLSSEIDEYNKAIRELENAARRASQNSSGTFVGGTMLWPCPSSRKITSGFGSRKSPGGVGSTNHKGIDIGAVSGAAIVAALDGKVIQCGYNKARGNYIMIDHGGGTITLYQHGKNGTTKVSVGQSVKQGQTIMGVGSTGYSTGNHLHFEVWKNGTPVNPQNFDYIY